MKIAELIKFIWKKKIFCIKSKHQNFSYGIRFNNLILYFFFINKFWILIWFQLFNLNFFLINCKIFIFIKRNNKILNGMWHFSFDIDSELAWKWPIQLMPQWLENYSSTLYKRNVSFWSRKNIAKSIHGGVPVKQKVFASELIFVTTKNSKRYPN